MKKTHILSLLLVSTFTSPFIAGCSSSSKDSASGDHKVVTDHSGEGSSDGTGFWPFLRGLKAPPPKVALVSVYVVDPVKKHEAKNMSTAQWMHLNHAKVAANKIFEHGFPAMKKEFAKHGMNLMAPDEFLTDEKKKKFYESFKLEHRPQPVQYAEDFLWGMTHHKKTVFHPADGFGQIYLMSAESMRAGTTAFDKTLIERLGNDLTKGLDVNAVLVVSSHFSVTDGQTVHDETSMYMFGPNPIPHKEVDRSGKVRYVAHKYAGVRAPYDFTFTGNAENPDNFEGYDDLLKVLSRAMGQYLNDETRFKGMK